MAWRRVWITTRKGKKGLRFCIQHYDDRGRLRTEAVGPVRKIAEEIRRQRELELNAGLLRTMEPIRLKAFTADHLELVRSQVAPGTREDQALILKHLLEFAGDVRLDAITARTAEAYVSQRAGLVAPATVNRELRTLSAVFARAIRRGYLRANPFLGIRPLKEPEKTLRILTAEEVQALLEACRQAAWRAFIFVGLSTGMRRGEIAALEWRDVDFEAGRIEVRCTAEHRTKSARNRTAILLESAAALLRPLRARSGEGLVFRTRRGTGWGAGTFRGFSKIVEKAGIAPCTLHDLRRTFCSHLAMAGVSEATTAALAGHSALETTRRHYTRILPDALVQASGRLPWAGFTVITNSCRGASDAKTGKTA